MGKRFFLFGLIGLILGGALVSAADSRSGSDEAAARRAKARYYYLQGAEENAKDNLSTAYTLFRKAYESDPTYDEAAYAYGTFRMSMLSDTLEDPGVWEESVRLRRRLIDAYPSDYAQVRLYAQQIVADPGRSFEGKPVVNEAVRVLERLDSLGSPTAYHLLQLSGLYSYMEMPDSVLGALSRYERREGSTPELLESKVGLLFKSGASDRAVREIENYRKGHPREEYPLILMSMLKYAQDDMDSTFIYLRQAEELNPNSFEVKSRIAGLALQQGDTTLFCDKVLEAIELPEGGYEEKTELFKDYMQIYDPEDEETDRKIRHAFTSLHGQFPQDAQLYMLEAAAELAAGREENSTELFRRAVAINPEDVLGRNALIQNLLIRKMHPEALLEIEKAWDEVGFQQDLRSLAVSLAIEQEDYGKAISILKRAAKELNPEIDIEKKFTEEDTGKLASFTYQMLNDLVGIFSETGDVAQKMGDFDGMVRGYESALVLAPNSQYILNNYAYFLSLEDKNLERALEMAEKANLLEPGNPMYTDTKAWVLFRMGRLEEAEKIQEETVRIYDDAITANPGNESDIEEEMREALIHYGAILWKLGKEDEARKQWERVLKSDPENKEAKEYLKSGYSDK